MAEKACNGFASTTQVGVTQALDAMIETIVVVLAAAATGLPMDVDPPPVSDATYTIPPDVCWAHRELRCNLNLDLQVSESGAVPSARISRSSGNRICDVVAKNSSLKWEYAPSNQPHLIQVHVQFQLCPPPQ